jgi:integrase
MNKRMQIKVLPDGFKIELKDRRLKLAVDIALTTALRLSEILSLMRENISENGQIKPVIPVVVKGGWARDVYLPESLRERIKEFIESDRDGWRGPLFQRTLCKSQHTGRALALPRVSLEWLWRHAQMDAGIVKPWRFHDLRHTAITRYYDWMVKEGKVDLMKLAAFAGHADPKTTMQYTHPRPEVIHADMDAMSRAGNGGAE